MLYFLFIYQSKTGILLYEKDFQVNNQSHMDLFGAFFSALKTFISELAIEGLSDLKTVGLGTFTAFVIQIPDANADLIIIADNEDFKLVKKLSSKFVKIINEYKELFAVKEIDSKEFEDFDKKINEFILSDKRIIDPSILIDKQEEILKSIWEQKGQISEHLREEKKKEEEELLDQVKQLKLKLQGETNIIKKYSFCKKILECSEKLEDSLMFKEYQTLAKTLYFQIEERKIRLTHYLNKTKESLNEILNRPHRSILNVNFRNVYSNLYSFSSKLKNFAPDITYNKYLGISRKLIDKLGINSDEFQEILNEISNMDENIESYYPPNL